MITSALRLAGVLVLLPGMLEPAVSRLSPSTVIAGDAAFWLTITGSGFVPGSIVRINGADRTTTVLSLTTIAALIAARDISRVGVHTITVHAPDAGASSSVSLHVVAPPPPPTLVSIAPSEIAAGQHGVRLTVTGRDFTAGSLIEIDGTTRPTFDATGSTLVTTLDAAELVRPGRRRIRVVTPPPGGGTSGAAELTIQPASEKARKAQPARAGS